MHVTRILFPVVLLALAGCANEAQTYISQHPSLSPEHREILTRHKVPAGFAVAGMSREEVRMALGDPTTYDKVNGEDAWIYVRQKAVARRTLAEADPSPGSGYTSFNKPTNFEPDTAGPRT